MLDGSGENALVTSTNAGATMIKNPTVGIEKALQSFGILIIEAQIIIGAKMTGFGHSM